MPSAAAVRAAFDRDREMRHACYAKDVTLDGTKKTGIYSPPVFERVQAGEGGGSEYDFDATVKLKKADWPAFPTSVSFNEKIIKIHLEGGLVVYQIKAVTDLHNTGEWKLVLEAMV
ncbi:hypothetical protein [Verrucomicrobium spinosum]|uniref:hypothetical protein n=1 Tax=Verrucomicrobium spinosum TaxID=2736 RepID=UPI00017465E7|nr:hypothetical protein [Verrucomicrobium spinosum]